MGTVRRSLETCDNGIFSASVDNWFNQEFDVYRGDARNKLNPASSGLFRLINTCTKRNRSSAHGFHLLHSWEDTPPMEPKPSTQSPSYPLLSELVRQALDTLPEDLRSDRNPLYVAGVGGELMNCREVRLFTRADNCYGESVLEIMRHPFTNIFEGLPQGLSLVGMYSELMRDAASTSLPTAEEYAEMQNSLSNVSSGTISPWAYFGNSATFFPLHMEDSMIGSANVLVAGSPKVWITIPFPHVDKLLQILSRTYPNHALVFPSHAIPAWARPCILVHREIFVHPLFLTYHGIPFTVARQAPGDLIIADARGAHQGWNVGQNLASSLNFLDEHTIRNIASNVIRGGAGPWHCVCGREKIPKAVPSYTVPEEHSTLGFILYHNPHVVLDRTNSVFLAWIHDAASVLSMPVDRLLDEGSHPFARWAHLYRWMYGRSSTFESG